MTELLRELEAVALLPCPFCGTDDHETSPWPSGTEWVCNCGNPDCAVEVTAETPQEAIAKWNRRAHHAEIAEAVRNARRWRVARNNTGDGLRLVRWDHSKPEELQVMFPSPTLCDSDADTAIDAHNSAREVGG